MRPRRRLRHARGLTELQTPPDPAVDSGRELLAAREGELGALHPDTIAAAEELALAQVRAGQGGEAVELLRAIAARASTELGTESEVTGIAHATLATVLARTGAPASEQLSTLTEAITAFSASVGPSHERTTAVFARLATVALDAQAIEIAVTAGMQAIAGLQARGEGETPRAGGVYATLAMAAAARRSPAALGAAERADRLTREPGAGDADRKRAQAAWRTLGSPRRLHVTDELSIIAFGSPPALVVELERSADDGAADQHNHGLVTDAARALRDAIAAAPPFAWRASAGLEVASRSAGGAVVRFSATAGTAEDVEVVLDAAGLQALRAAIGDGLSGAVAGDQPARNDPCPCGSGAKFKRCCGR